MGYESNASEKGARGGLPVLDLVGQYRDHRADDRLQLVRLRPPAATRNRQLFSGLSRRPGKLVSNELVKDG